jgi:DUF971 family protein
VGDVLLSGGARWAAGSRDGELELATGDRVLRYPAVWLRDSCPCAECTDPGTGQKLHDVTDIPLDCAVARVESDGTSPIAVTFAPDGHRTAFELDWLVENALDRADDEHEGMVLRVAESFGFVRCCTACGPRTKAGTPA